MFNVHFQFDYSLDASGFFADQNRRDLLQLAGTMLSNRLQDNLSAITPGGGNTWTLQMFDPATGLDRTMNNVGIAANTLLVFVGSRSLSGTELGEGGPGGYQASGTNAWINNVKGRGQSGALTPTPTDFGPWGGSISFDGDASWFFGTTVAGLTPSSTDFLTVALHELTHLVGFGTAASFTRFVSAGVFNGPAAKAQYDAGGAVPLSPDGSHWQDGLTDNGAGTVMDPTVSGGERKQLTALDLGALTDIGWQIKANTAPVLDASANPLLTAIKEDATNAENPGTLISVLLETMTGSTAPTDADGDAIGIAVIGADTTHGQWFYRNHNTGSYANLATVDNNSARLLSADSALRFVPDSDYSGSATLTFRFWDGTSGASGGTANTIPNGGANAFSSATETASITITTRADAPDVTPASTLEDVPTTSGLVITPNPGDGTLVTHFKIVDVQHGSVYLHDGVTVLPVGNFLTLAQGAAGLIFKPEDDFYGTATVDVLATIGLDPDVDPNAITTASISVTSVNDAPSFTLGPNIRSHAGDFESVSNFLAATSSGPQESDNLSFTLAVDRPELFDVVPNVVNGLLQFQSKAGAQGTAKLTMSLKDDGGTANGGVDTAAPQVLLIGIDSLYWQNVNLPADVNADGSVTPVDALLVINALNAGGAHTLAPPASGIPQPNYIDTSGDEFLSPTDALLVINHLNTAQNAAFSPPTQAHASAPAPAKAMASSSAASNPVVEVLPAATPNVAPLGAVTPAAASATAASAPVRAAMHALSSREPEWFDPAQPIETSLDVLACEIVRAGVGR